MTPIGMRTSAGQAIAALSCLGVSKVFPVLDEGTSWRVLWRDPLQDRTIRALHEVTLSVPKGKMVGVLGRNGAGKSTLLRVLAGVSEPFAGTIERTGSLSGLFELGMGSNRFLTGREYARRSLLLQGVARAQLPDLLEDIREFAELDADFGRSTLWRPGWRPASISLPRRRCPMTSTCWTRSWPSGTSISRASAGHAFGSAWQEAPRAFL